MHAVKAQMVRFTVCSVAVGAAVCAGPASAAPAPVDPLQQWALTATSAPTGTEPTATLVNTFVPGCLTATGASQVTVVRACAPVNVPGQRFLVRNVQIISPVQNLCLTGNGPNNPTTIATCDGLGHQNFAVKPDKTIRNTFSGLCLTATRPNSPTIMKTCSVP